jgi:hypothetical protein
LLFTRGVYSLNTGFLICFGNVIVMVVCSQATNEYKVEYLAYSKMSRHCTWTVTWYKLLDSIRPTEACVPHTVSAVPLVIRAAGSQFWPPTRQRHKNATVATQLGVLGGGDGEEHDGWGSVAGLTYDLDEDQGIGEPGHGDDCGLPPVDDGLLARAEAEYHLRAEEEASAELAHAPPGVPAEPEHAEHAPATPGAVAPGTPAEGAPGTPALSQHSGHSGMPRAFGSRTVPVATVELPGGRISFQSSTSSFQATCMNKGHGTCLMTRTSHCRLIKGHGVCGGRPVGFLATWLAHHGVATKSEHWDKTAMQYTHAERLEHRMQVVASAAGATLCSFERELEEGEGLEPDTLKGLL